MKFTELKITNFLALTEASLRLDDRGLVLVEGKNTINPSAKSNGAGKSSIMDALCWCWFGTTARGVTGDDVINRTAKKGTSVSSTVLDNNITYTATRHRKHKTGKNSLQITMNDGLTDTDLTKGTDKLTQEVARKIIGASLDVFTGSIYAGQEKMPDLPAMTDKALKLLIEEAAGITLLEEAYQKAREGFNAIKAKVEKAQGVVDQTVQKLGWVDGQIVNTTNQVDVWATNHTTKVAALKQRAVSEVLTPLKQVTADIAAAATTGDLSAAISACDQKISAVSGEQQQMTQLEGAVISAQGNVNNADRRQSATERDIQLCNKALQDVDKKIGTPCSECSRPITISEIAAARQAAQNALTAAEEKGLLEAKECREARHALKEAIAARDAFKETLTDLTAVGAERNSLHLQMAQSNRLETQKVRLTEDGHRIKKEIVALSSEENPHLATLDRLEKEHVSALESHKDAEKERDLLMTQLAVEQEVVKIYGPAGVRARVLDDITPYLNAQTAKYLSVLTDDSIDATWSTVQMDSRGNPKERFAIDVTSMKDAGKFDGFSGGEKRKIRVACALALQDLVSTRATKPIDLFLADEVDDALDDAGLERLISVLEEKVKDRGSVFVISHNPLRDWISQVVTVEKTAKGSTIYETAA